MKEYDIKDYQKQQEIVQTKIEYAYGILMEKGDRLIDDDYEEGVSYYKKANKLFTEAKELSLDYIIKSISKLYSMDEKRFVH